MDIIELKNIRHETNEEEYIHGIIGADIYINGECHSQRGYCDLSTFFIDSHLLKNKFSYIPTNKKEYSVPNQNKPSFYSGRSLSIDFSLTEEQKYNLPKNDYFKNKKIKKIIFKNKKNKSKLINPKFLKEREERNEHFQNYAKTSYSYLDSCSCGQPGCNGIWNGVLIKKGKNKITYKVNKDDGYHNGILGSGLFTIKISIENLNLIRKQLTPFFKNNCCSFY